MKLSDVSFMSISGAPDIKILGRGWFTLLVPVVVTDDYGQISLVVEVKNGEVEARLVSGERNLIGYIKSIYPE